MLPHSLTNFEIQKYQNDSKFNGVYSRNNLFKLKYVAYVINLTSINQQELVGQPCKGMVINLTYFDSFRVEHTAKNFNCFGVERILRKIKKSIGSENITTNIFRIQAYDSAMCQQFCIGFIDCMLKGATLLEYANLFSSNKYEKSDKIMLKYFQQILKKLK